MRIAISGAGVAGPTLAYWLQRSGHDPFLIERAPEPRAGGYIVDFWGIGYTVAERMGLLPAILRAGYEVREVRLVDRHGRTAGGFPASVFRHMTQDRFVSLPRGDLAAILAGACTDVETLFGDAIASIAQKADGLRLRLESGGERCADLLVGADGLHSRVRSLVFGPPESVERFLGYRVAAFELPDYAPRDPLVYVSHSRPGRQVARFALRDGRTLFYFIFAAGADLPEPRTAAERKALIVGAFADVGWECPAILRQMQALPDIYLDRVSQIRLPRWSDGRVVLLGDAAAAVSLLAGEGCGLAMAESYVLAAALADAQGDHARAFAAYEGRLRPFIVAKQRRAERFAASFVPRTAVGVRVRNWITRLLRFPPLADLAIGQSVRDDLRLPDWLP